MDGERSLLSPAHRVIGMSFVMDFCATMTMLAAQNLGVLVLRAPPAVLGLFGTARAAAKSITSLFTGTGSDRYGRRCCAIAGCILAGIAWCLLANAASWQGVVLMMSLLGLGLALFWPAIQAWLAELTANEGRRLSNTLGLFNIVWAAGMMLGPVSTGYLWPLNYSLTFYVPAILAVVLVGLILLTPSATTRSAESVSEARSESRPDNPLFMLIARIGNFASYFAGAIIVVMFPKLAYDVLQLTAAEVGWLLFCVQAGQLLMFVFTRHYQRWQYHLWLMVFAEIAAAGAMVTAVFATSRALFAAGFMMVGVSAGITYVSSLYYGLHGHGVDKGKQSGVHEAVVSTGRVFGPLLGGLAAQYIGLRAPYAVAAAMFVLAAVVQVWLYNLRTPQPGKRDATHGEYPGQIE